MNIAYVGSSYNQSGYIEGYSLNCFKNICGSESEYHVRVQIVRIQLISQVTIYTDMGFFSVNTIASAMNSD